MANALSIGIATRIIHHISMRLPRSRFLAPSLDAVSCGASSDDAVCLRAGKARPHSDVWLARFDALRSHTLDSS